jgi:hypothetical protein
MHTQQKLTPELASRMAVTAVTTDIEYWARTACVDGHVGLNELIRSLDVIREASAVEGWGVRSVRQGGRFCHERASRRPSRDH